MAAIAMAPKATTMNIIPTMTAVTVVRGLFVFCQIRAMALIAIDLTVFSLQGKVGLVIVIEGPQ